MNCTSGHSTRHRGTHGKLLQAIGKTQLSLALRFTQSRRGAAKRFADSLRDGSFAQVVKTIPCGQANRGVITQATLAARIEKAALLLVQRAEKEPFKDITACIGGVFPRPAPRRSNAR